MPLKIDLHVHTWYSTDSVITLEDLMFYARKRGLDGVAITDHDRVHSTHKIVGKKDLLIVPGVEVSSADGHVIGLLVEKEIPRGLDVAETVDRIHDAGGIAVACHPGAVLKKSIKKMADARFDAVEVINSSSIPFGSVSRRSEQIAFRLGVARVAGSDAHYGPEIGCAYTVIEAERTAESVVDAIRNGRCEPFGTSIPFAVRLKRIAMVRFPRRNVPE